ncbi:hypothetical protein H4Q26_007302 [Puccinia striiformis f. sp. tritici PST-130]|nr:hypothetical protein H4Q26_007302 [Puccinia striiformis f. sp. tritici PST-130]
MFEYGQIKSGSRSPSRGVNPVPFYYPALGCHRAIQLFHHRSGSTQTIFKIRLLSAFHRVVLFLKRPSHALRPGGLHPIQAQQPRIKLAITPATVEKSTPVRNAIGDRLRRLLK